jgi:hypothetical protein
MATTPELQKQISQRYRAKAIRGKLSLSSLMSSRIRSLTNNFETVRASIRNDYPPRASLS